MIDQNKFIVYNASAGSGKTYTLVKEYLLLLLQSPRHDVYKNILAITFTNKAVAEMKSRIISNLNALAAEECPTDCKSLMNDLKEETNYSENEIRLKARKILKSILHNYASFDISTIDRFTHKVIRTFAKDLGIPLNFEVELNTLHILQEAVDKLINRAGENKALTRVLVNFTLSKTDEDKSWDIARDLFTFSKILLFENHQPYVSALNGKTLKDFNDFGEKLKREIAGTDEHLKELADAFFNIAEAEGLEKMDFNRGSCFGYFVKVREKDFKKITYTANWQTNIEEDKLYAGKCHPSKKAILDRYHSEISALFLNSRAAFFRRDYLKEVLTNLTPLSLLSEIAVEIDRIKKERSLVLISDFNPTIASQVKDQPAPFIYERLGERYRNYFIDEFQDTSEMQWTNIIPLIDNALSSEPKPGSGSGLVIVGDAKQSIYRFRGGKAEQFIGLYNEESKENPFSIKQRVNNLPYNFRSAVNIVEFNNSFFKYVSGKFQNPLYKDLYAQSTQISKKEIEGYVNISFLDTNTVEEEMEVHPEKVFEIIQNLEQKSIPKSDICILTRTRRQGFAVANYLNERGISIVSSESLLISNSPEVNFINHLLEFTIHTRDRNLKWEILNYLVQKLNMADPHRVIVENIEFDGKSLFEWLGNYNINFDLNKLKELTLYEGAEYIIRSFSLIERSDAYLQFYLDFIFDKTQNTPIGVMEFLELWEINKEKLSVIAPKTGDAVQIMTIHKSKGLEFPVVIYPFANSKLNDVSKEHIWLKLPEEINDIPYSYFKGSSKMLNWGEYEKNAYEQLLSQSEFDTINLLYVTFTRASEQLYILSCPELKKGEPIENKISGLLIGYLQSVNKWEGTINYEIGKVETNQQKAEPLKTSAHPEKYFSSPTLNDTVNIVTRDGELWGSPQEKAINNGNLVHNILSETETIDDLPKAMEKYRKSENLSEEREAELLELISQVISHPKLKPYFSMEAVAYRERDIISPEGEILRPDRLNFNGKKVTILDYKTGKFRDSHKMQMEEYATILSTMGFEVVNKILIYINAEVNISFV